VLVAVEVQQGTEDEGHNCTERAKRRDLGLDTGMHRVFEDEQKVQKGKGDMGRTDSW